MTLREANRRLASDLKLVVRDAEDLLEATAGEAGEKLNEVRNRLAATLESAKATRGHLREGTAHAAQAADRAVRDNTYKFIGIAFGLALLIGVLAGRR